MKKILALAAVAALTAGVSAYAANPFSDVSQDDWAYQAVSDLSVQGVVEGYPDGTFKGERNMTRYELAQIVARMLAKEDQLNAEQKATLDKLAAEFADELSNLGVRVSNLEKKVGNLYWSGDARMQYQRNIDFTDSDKKKSDTWSGRMRINVKGQVNDKVAVYGRFVNEMDFKDGNSSSTEMDRLYTKWEPNEKTFVSIGRQGVALDQTGTFWDEDGVFDGIVVGYDNGKLGVEAGYGRFKDAYKTFPAGIPNTHGEGVVYADTAAMEAWYAKLTGHIGDRADVSAFYLKNTNTPDGSVWDPGSETDDTEPSVVPAESGKLSVWGIGTTVELGKKFVFDADYVRTKPSGDNHAALWTAGLTYGKVDTKKVGSWSLGLHYVKAQDGSYILGNSALDMTDQLDYGFISGLVNDDPVDVHFWVAKAGVALQKNVELDAYYNFSAKSSNKDAGDPDDTWGIELNYTF